MPPAKIVHEARNFFFFAFNIKPRGGSIVGGGRERPVAEENDTPGRASKSKRALGERQPPHAVRPVTWGHPQRDHDDWRPPRTTGQGGGGVRPLTSITNLWAERLPPPPPQHRSASGTALHFYFGAPFTPLLQLPYPRRRLVYHYIVPTCILLLYIPMRSFCSPSFPLVL